MRIEQIFMVSFGQRPSRRHNQNLATARAPTHGAEHRLPALVDGPKKVGFVFVAPAAAGSARKLDGPRSNDQHAARRTDRRQQDYWPKIQSCLPPQLPPDWSVLVGIQWERLTGCAPDCPIKRGETWREGTGMYS
jgi:hypothetical protein